MRKIHKDLSVCTVYRREKGEEVICGNKGIERGLKEGIELDKAREGM
jgi:hypothetical protein